MALAAYARNYARNSPISLLAIGLQCGKLIAPPLDLLLDQLGNQHGCAIFVLCAPHINMRCLEVEMHQPLGQVENCYLGSSVFEECRQSRVAHVILQRFPEFYHARSAGRRKVTTQPTISARIRAKT